MKLGPMLAGCLLSCAVLCWSARADEVVPLSSLDVSKMTVGWASPRAKRSVDGNELRIAGKSYADGVGTHAESAMYVDLKGGAKRFLAEVGIDDEIGNENAGTVEFRVIGDGRELWRSGRCSVGKKAKSADVELSGVKQLILMVTDAGDGINYDHADWADARFIVSGVKPVAIDAPREEAVILTPPPPPEPRITGARVYGVRPGHPIIFHVPATGERPMTYSADGLPAGAVLDPRTGNITGRVAEPGDYKVALHARNARGAATREWRLVVGDTIALTPPMGWNSWNCFASAITADKVKAAAKAMAESGLMEHGWSFINIDDYWEVKPGSNDASLQGPGRDQDGYMIPNPRFPDMKGLADYVHGLGLKMGIYSSPGPLTCGGCLGSYQHELHDAESYAKWGVDYLKYDWCSYGRIAKGSSLYELMKPYFVMRDALLKQDRDIVFSLCQYGMGNVSAWGAVVGGNCWRTTGDITDTWGSMSGIGFGQNGLEHFAGPGHWNDPDMLVVGHVGWGPRLHPTKLTPNEQYTHMSLWCLLCSPLLIGCDLTKLDAFTMNLLSNDEVLEVSQDPLGCQAHRVADAGSTEVWAKTMLDGSTVAGLFNRGESEAEVTASWEALGLKGRQVVRDVWRQKDIGACADAYAATVPRHGVVLVRLRGE